MKAAHVGSASDIISLLTRRVQRIHPSRMTIAPGVVDVPTKDLLPHSCNRNPRPQFSLHLEDRYANRSLAIMVK